MTLAQVSLNIHNRVKVERMLICIFLLSFCNVGLVSLHLLESGKLEIGGKHIWELKLYILCNAFNNKIQRIRLNNYYFHRKLWKPRDNQPVVGGFVIVYTPYMPNKNAGVWIEK